MNDEGLNLYVRKQTHLIYLLIDTQDPIYARAVHRAGMILYPIEIVQTRATVVIRYSGEDQ
jgi:hypothetical protein